MRVHILSIFPGMFNGWIGESIVARACARGLVEVNLIDIRDYAHDKHRSVDDYPFGGGAGMVMRPEPIFEAVETIIQGLGGRRPGVILLTPQGTTFNQEKARELSLEEELILICGRYEGVDERVAAGLVTDEISVGDYVLTGGELAAMVVVDAVARLLPGVLGDASSAREDSFSEGLFEYPQYTRPQRFREMEVPPVLLSGNHKEIEKWRRQQALWRTYRRRPDLWDRLDLTEEDFKLFAEILAREGEET